MTDRNKKFHEFALKSILFKGRADWYFCYLKTERIAHVLVLLANRSSSPRVRDIALSAASVPADIARLAGGELAPAGVLAEVFVLLSALRIAGTEGLLSEDNVAILVREYEQAAERLAAGSHLSPFVGPEDFFIPEPAEEPLLLRPRAEAPAPLPSLRVKDISKGQTKGQSLRTNDRASAIMAYIRKQKSLTGQGSSIKDIATVVRDCSEKTVQRELNGLIEQGLIRRVGERRWSLYEPI